MQACLNYCHDKGYEVSHRFSEAYSGLTLDRPKLRELQELIRAGYIDVIVIYCLDRISRDPTHGVILTQEFERLNVALEAVTEDISNSELGKLISYIRGFASKLEAEKIRERTMRGKMAYLKDGKLPQGTGIGIYGYIWDKTTGKRQIIDHETETVRRMFNMTINGIGMNKIAITLNQSGIKTKSGSLWYPLTIRRILKNQTYTGKTYFGKTKRVGKNKVEAQPKENWILLPDVTPPIITDEIFNRAQEAMKDAKDSRPLKPNASYLLTGFMRCSKCGSTIGGTTMNGKYRYYRCRGTAPTATRGKICDAGYINAHELEQSIWQRVIYMLSNPRTVLRTITEENKKKPEKIVAMLNKQINQLRKKLKTYPIKERKLYDLLAHEAVTKDYVLDTITKLKQESLNDEIQLKSLLVSRKEATQADHLRLKLSRFSFNKFSKLLYEYELRDLDKSSDSKSEEPPPLYLSPAQITKQFARKLSLKRSLFEAIRLKVQADQKSYQFTIALDGHIISTTEAHELSAFDDELRRFEKKHPDVSVKDLLDNPKLLPEDTPFVQKLNQLKQNLVTIEQTSA